MRYWIILITSICFVACQDIKRPERPENLISTDKMVRILTESYLANAARSVDNRSIVEAGVEMDSLFYKKFGVDSLQFVKSHAFYAANVDAYMTIIQEVESNLKEMEKTLDSIRRSQIQTKDSQSSPPNEKKPPITTPIKN